MPKITQDNRILRITTELEKDVLLINGFTAHEKLSGLFSADVELLHHHDTDTEGPPHDVPMKDILGKDATITVELPDGTKRYFNGIVSRFTLFNRDADFTHYRAEIVPKLWLLTRKSQSRIFQDKSVLDIIKEVLDGIEFKVECQGTYHPRNYCVQYRETDFNFISRLMEEEGIFYFFEHTENSHKMIIADTPQSHRDCPTKSTIEFLEKQTGEGFVSSITRWSHDYQLQSGKVTFWDYHFQLPTSKLDATHPTPDNIRIAATAEAEIFDFPGGYAKRQDGIDGGGGDQAGELQRVFEDNKRHAGIAAQVLNVQYKTIHGASTCSSLTAGHRFTLVNHPLQSANGQHVVTDIQHIVAQSPEYLPELSVDAPYTNTFTCIPYSVPFRPGMATFKPVVQGSQTAVVVGPSGEEIFTDKYGRVKVQFHWDRDGRNDASSSCWLRVGTSIAGNKWGTMFIPRIGQEVIVDFLEGDPDQPIIVGAVYNPLTMPHYELPKFKTLSYIKTRTSPDDGKGFNELRFEDKANKEQVFVHSQKRYDLRVKGSMYETCGGNRQEVIGMRSDNQPGGNLAISVGGNFDLHVKGDHYIGIDGKLNETVKGDVIKDYQAVFHTQVGSKAEMTAPQITFEANSKITFKVGSSFITLDPSGVTISGPMVKINSGGTATGPSFPSMDEPLDAEAADTGEPGYLDRPRTGGGGGGRRRKILHGNRLPNVRQNADGSFQVGNNIRVVGTPEFTQKALTNLSTLSSTQTGNNIITALDNGTHQTTIQELDMATAQQNGALAQRVDQAGSVTPGVGSDTIISYNPDLVDNTYTDENGVTHTMPIESTLGHEMIHAVHNDSGNNLRNNPEPAEAGSNEEESQTIGIHGHADDEMTENNILRDMNQDFRRTDHDSTVQTVP